MANILGVTKRMPIVDRAGKMSSMCAEALLNAAHIPVALCRAARRGAEGILRAQAFVVRLTLELQMRGSEAMLASMAHFKDSFKEVVGHGGECETIVAICHSWDETRQMLREPPRHSHARQATQNIARNIMVQKALVYASAFFVEPGGGVSEHTRAETIIVPPLELHGKNTNYIIAALRKGLLFRIFDRAAVQATTSKVSAIVMTFWGDAASTNRKTMRHVAGLTEEPTWPRGALVDVGQVCLVHQIHRVKVQLVDVHGMVSLMFCLTKLVKAGAILGLAADHIGKLVDRRCKRVVQAPPRGAAARAKQTLDMIFRFDTTSRMGRKAPRSPACCKMWRLCCASTTATSPCPAATWCTTVGMGGAAVAVPTGTRRCRS